MSLLAGIGQGLSGAGSYFEAKDRADLAKLRYEQDLRAYNEGAEQRAATLENTRAATRASNLASDANQLTLVQNRRNMAAQAGLDYISKIDAAGRYRVQGGDFGEYDFKKLSKERPDLAAGVFGMQPEYQRGFDADGNPIQLEFAGVIDNGDGTASLAVRGPDGKLAPVTENRTGAPDDTVFRLPWSEFNKLGTRYLKSMASVNGSGTWFRDMEDYTDSFLRAEAVLLAQETPEIAENPAALSAITYAINSPNSTRETAETIIKDFNGDPEAVKAEAEKRYNRGAGDTNVDVSVVDEQFYTNGEPQTKRRKGLNDMSYEERVQYFKDNPIRQTGGVGSTNIYDTGGPVGEAVSGVVKGVTDFFNNRQKDMVQDLVDRKAAGESLTSGEEKALREYGPKFPDVKPQAKEVGSDGATPPPSNVPLYVELDTPEGAIAAVTGEDTQPTEQQVNGMAAYLQSQNVQDAKDLRKLPPKEVLKAAYIAASRYPIDQRMTVFQSLLNLAKTGDTTVTADQAIGRQLEAGRLDLNRGKFIDEVRNNALDRNKELTKDVTAAITSAYDDFAEFQTSLLDKETGELTRPSNEATIKLGAIWNKAASVPTNSPEYLGYSKIAMESLLTHMLAMSNSQQPGFYEFADKINNWWNDEGELRVGINAVAGLVRETPQGAFVFLDPNGGQYNFEISKRRFRDVYGTSVMQQIEKQARANATRARVQATNERRQANQ